MSNSNARNSLIAKNDHIKTLRLVIGFLVLALIAFWLFINKISEERKIYIPPDLSNGYITNFEVVPKHVIYSFTYYVFQQLNRWKENGEEDYPANIYRLQAFVTPSCLSALHEDMNNKMRLGELNERTRYIQELEGKGYEASNINAVTKTRWIVSLYLNLKEEINRHPVKDINVRYDVPIVKFDVDRTANPWGLAISCDNTTHPILLDKPST
jgi:integrating conjugative element protein (TIGR03746 family)